MLKLTCIVGALAAVVALSFVIDGESRSETHPAASATASAPSAEIHAPGRVEGATEEIDLRPQLFGRVKEVLVREGQIVAAGAPLVRLDNSQQEYQCEAAEAELAAAEAELDRIVNGARDEERRAAAADVEALAAQLESTRQRQLRIANLREKGASTAQDLDDLNAQVKGLEAQRDAARARHDLLEAPARDEDVRLARARVKTARSRLEVVRDECGRALLTAPLSAQLLRVNVQAGDLTGPDSTEPALILADTSRLYVRAYVDEFDAPRLHLAMRARVTADGLPQNAVEGRVVRLAPRMVQKPLRTDDPLERFDTKVREAWIELDPSGAENFVIGLPVDVVLEAAPSGAKQASSQGASPATDGAPQGQ